MQLLFISAICIIAISLVVIVIVRIHLKNKSKELSERIATITPYRNIQESREKELKQSNKSFFIDIETDLRNSFDQHIISSSEEEQFTKYYTGFFHEINSLLKNLETFHMNRPRQSQNLHMISETSTQLSKDIMSRLSKIFLTLTKIFSTIA